MNFWISWRGRPDILEEHRRAVASRPERLARQIHLHRARKRVGDDEGRGGQVVRLHVGADAALEVAVPRQHRRGDDAVGIDCGGYFRRERPGVPDARGAAEADEIEADLVEVGLQAGLVEIGGDNLRARRERGLDPGFARQTLLDRLLGHKSGGDQHARVRRIGAARDRGDDDVAVADVEVAAGDGRAL